jgi:hypothetical protein
MQLGVFVERGVEVVDVGLMMLPMMELHRLGVDVGLERSEVVRQRRQGMRHDPLLRDLTGGSYVSNWCVHVTTPLAAAWPAAGKMHGARADFKLGRPRVARPVARDDIVQR